MSARTLITTYYGPNVGTGRNSYKPVIKVTHSSNRDELLPNVCRHMTRNDYGAVVATVHDSELGELLLVVTYAIGSQMKIVFESCVTNPITKE